MGCKSVEIGKLACAANTKSAMYGPLQIRAMCVEIRTIDSAYHGVLLSFGGRLTVFTFFVDTIYVRPINTMPRTVQVPPLPLGAEQHINTWHIYLVCQPTHQNPQIRICGAYSWLGCLRGRGPRATSSDVTAPNRTLIAAWPGPSLSRWLTQSALRSSSLRLNL